VQRGSAEEQEATVRSRNTAAAWSARRPPVARARAASFGRRAAPPRTRSLRPPCRARPPTVRTHAREKGGTPGSPRATGGLTRVLLRRQAEQVAAVGPRSPEHDPNAAGPSKHEGEGGGGAPARFDTTYTPGYRLRGVRAAPPLARPRATGPVCGALLLVAGPWPAHMPGFYLARVRGCRRVRALRLLPLNRVRTCRTTPAAKFSWVVCPPKRRRMTSRSTSACMASSLTLS